MLSPTRSTRRVAVVGAGPAGLAATVGLAERGHAVDLIERLGHLGGQFDLARRIPGKEEFAETVRYFRRRLEVLGVRVHLGVTADADTLRGYDDVVVATGVRPRVPGIAGVEHPSVVPYDALLRGDVVAGERVAVIGAGGVGIDVTEFLTHDASPTLDPGAWRTEWGVGDPALVRGGVTTPRPGPSPRRVHLVQRKRSRVGAGLGTTTGWVHRASVRAKGVETVVGAQYERVDDDGLHLRVERVRRVLAVDTVVLCAGQEPVRDLVDGLAARGVRHHVIGGAERAVELDAKRAVEQGTRLAAAL